MRRPHHMVKIPIPEGLHPATERLVADFARALAAKLRDAEEKYGYSSGWMRKAIAAARRLFGAGGAG